MKKLQLRSDYIIGLALAVIAFGVFANSIQNNYNLDDELVTEHHKLTSQGISAIAEIFTSYYFDNKIGNQYEYRPMVLTTFAIEHTFFDEDPHTSHAINVLLYALTVMILFFTLRSVLPGNNFAVSIIATLLFAVLPLHTEAIDSIKNRDEILCFMGGILAWRYADRFAKAEKGAWVAYALFILFFAIGILSKRSILSYSIIIPLALLWINNTASNRMIFIVFPLAIGFYLLSPSGDAVVTIVVTLFIIFFPFTVKYFFQTGGNIHIIINDLKQQVHSILDSTGKQVTVAANQQEGHRGYWLWFIGYSLVTIAFLVGMIFLDSRILIAGGLVILTLIAIFAPLDLRWLFTIITSSLAILLALDFDMAPVVWYVILLLGVAFYSSAGVSRVITGALMLFSALAYVLCWPGFVSNVDMLLLLSIISLYTLLAGKKLQKIIIAYYIIGFATGLFTGFKDIIPWLLPIVFAIYYLALGWENTRRLMIPLMLAGMLVFMGVQFWQHRDVANDLYFTLAAKPKPVKAKPDDSPKTELSVIPAAGRQLDFVENPLKKDSSVQHKLATPLKIMGIYLQLMAAPVVMRFYYGYNQVPVSGWTDPVVWLVILTIAASLWAAIKYRTQFPALTFGIVYLWLSLLLISNLGVPVAGIIAERLAFIASLGFCLIFAGLLELVFKTQNIGNIKELLKKPALAAIVLLVSTAYAGRSFVRNSDWKDRLTLYTHDIKDLPNSAKAQQLMGFEYLQMATTEKNKTIQNNEMENAKGYLLRSIEIAPEFHSPVYNMAYLYALKDSCPGAIPWLERSLKLEPYVPEALFHYAVCLESQNRMAEAVEQYGKAIQYDPKCLDCYIRLSYIHFRMGRMDRAIAVNRQGLKFIPNSFELDVNLGKTYLTINDYQNALYYFENAYSQKPEDKNLALALADISNRLGDKVKYERYRAIANTLGGK